MQYADVRVGEGRDGARFSLEALAFLGLAGELAGQDLDGYRAVQASVLGAIHFAHAPSTEKRNNLIGSELLTWNEGHKWRDYSARTEL